MLHKIKKILVANRSEIAIRVLRGASELKIRTVAVYTYEDRYALHRYKADESYQIGPDDEPLKPYLDIEEILRIAKSCHADAIHPGYGFLSENIDFVRRCDEEGILFIGPEAETMARLGDKIEAKKLAKKVRVPLIEGSVSAIRDTDELTLEAERIGYPVMIKAAAGGGGRGIRIVRDEMALIKSYNEAKAEALTAFGDDTIFVEKFVENPKHIEVQILADKHGNTVHLYERDCSVQRRFQKVVEVAPAMNLRSETKEKLYEYALALAREAKYTHAGTVEFLVDREENIFFIEVNPRIQVEHTVTEQITGIDIVRAQILIAMGYRLDEHPILIPNQASIKCDGFAIQCRITTENPMDDFKPDYGTIVAYRSASGFGIRLDAGTTYPGAVISPFFDSLLVKITAWGRTLEGASLRLNRALREFRIRGVKTNIGFLLNMVQNKAFQSGNTHVNFIKENPQLLRTSEGKNRGTKILRYLGNVIVNGHPDIKFTNPDISFRKPIVPPFDKSDTFPKGTKQLLTEMGPEGFSSWIKGQKVVQFTDTTFRDAHQSLLATRVRSYDLLNVAESFAKNHAQDLFSMEVWGGATFDVCMRFLNEDPWKRLSDIRAAVPNVLLQMLLRASNAVGYASYPDNLVSKFIEEAWNEGDGIDIFRIFDSLNWLEAMKTSIRTVRERTHAIAEVCICYTGDVSSPDEKKFTLAYYLDLAKRMEDEGAHILCIKDMAGLLKPRAATTLITELKKSVDIPIHLHTHDTSSIQAATYLNAINAGVDIIDVALSSMSGLTSQPSFNAMAAMLEGHERENKVNISSLNDFSNYWEAVRAQYYPFETELKSGTAEVYEHEIPGGQYSNLRPQARGLGLEDQFETIIKNYAIANELFGGLIKVTPSSKVVGDMAMFMTSNHLTKEDILEKGSSLSFPDSVKALMRGDLGQIKGGFPNEIQKLVLKDEKPYTDRPNAHLEPINFETSLKQFRLEFDQDAGIKDFLSYALYPKVYKEFYEMCKRFGVLDKLPTSAYFYGLKPNEEIIVTIDKGKNLLIKYLNSSSPNEEGLRTVFFTLNGQQRAVKIKDQAIQSTVVKNIKASGDLHIGAPLQGKLSKILVVEGDEVTHNTALFTIEAMKMESTIAAPFSGKIKKIYLSENTFVEQDDLVMEFEN